MPATKASNASKSKAKKNKEEKVRVLTAEGWKRRRKKELVNRNKKKN